MNQTKNIVISAAVSAVIALLVVFVSGLVGFGNQSAILGGTRFPSGISADSTSPSAGQVRGTTLTITGASTLTGAATLSGANTLSATTTVSGPFIVTGTAKINQTTSSTLQIGYTASGLLHGCLVLGDSGGATSTPVYITATGATISATTTKPAICK